MDKLTVEECENYVDTPDNKYLINVNMVLRQLADTMRENEELKKHPLKLLCEKCNVLTDIHQHKESEPYKFQDRADDALELIANEKQNKHSDTSGSSNGRTADFDSANHGSSPCPESIQSTKQSERTSFVPGSIKNSGKGTVYIHSDNGVTSIEPGKTLYPDGSRTKTTDI